MSVATGIGPADLLAAPPAVFSAIVDILDERGKEDRRQTMRDKLRQMMGK